LRITTHRNDTGINWETISNATTATTKKASKKSPNDWELTFIKLQNISLACYNMYDRAVAYLDWTGKYRRQCSSKSYSGEMHFGLDEKCSKKMEGEKILRKKDNKKAQGLKLVVNE
jgi:hypothetical protein